MNIRRHEAKKVLSKAVEYSGFVYLSGLTADDKSKGVEDQTRDILKNVDRLLALAGSGKSRVLTATIWLSDITDRDRMNSAWIDWADPGNLPARACVEAKLGTPDCLVEIQITAAK